MSKLTVGDAISSRLDFKILRAAKDADRYKAVLTVLGIPHDMPVQDLDVLINMWKDIQ